MPHSVYSYSQINITKAFQRNHIRRSRLSAEVHARHNISELRERKDVDRPMRTDTGQLLTEHTASIPQRSHPTGFH